MYFYIFLLLLNAALLYLIYNKVNNNTLQFKEYNIYGEIYFPTYNLAYQYNGLIIVCYGPVNVNKDDIKKIIEHCIYFNELNLYRSFINEIDYNIYEYLKKINNFKDINYGKFSSITYN
jgi:hypothetical protein